jgi:small subunit ribosomal protein S9
MKNIVTSGRRKKSIARVVLTEGSGKITINKLDLNFFQPELVRLKILEPLILADDVSGKVDIAITVKGGGIINQADAARLAIGRALVQNFPKLKDLYLDYDRQLLVADIRTKEAAKPNHHGQARARTQTSYR